MRDPLASTGDRYLQRAWTASGSLEAFRRPYTEFAFADEYDPLFAMYYLYHGTITNLFESHYTGTTIKHLTGQALSRIHFPLPPVPEQRRIVAKIEELFSDLDAGVVALERVRANLKRYRAAVLKAAVEGKLTEDWRAQHPDTEPASVLLERILTERRRQWEKDQTRQVRPGGQAAAEGVVRGELPTSLRNGTR